MNIVFCYYDDINYDARAQEELEALQRIGNVHIVTIFKVNGETFWNVDFRVIGKRDYTAFLLLSVKAIKEIQPDLVFLHDNYCAPLIKTVRKSCNAKIAYDMSELYIGREGIFSPLPVMLKKSLLKHWEYKYIQGADIIIAANTQRAYIAKGYFGLKDVPIVFNNIRRIDCTVDEEYCEKKYKILLDGNAFIILFAGGLSYPNERDAEYVLKMMNELGSKYRLIIAGSKSNFNPMYNEVLKRNSGIDNIHYVGKIPRNELVYLYRHADVNIVTFALTTINNIYCASGKFNEGIFEGLPVICSENPPLCEICEKYSVGVVAVNHNYLDAVKKIESNISYYRENVKKYVLQLDYKSRIDDLTNNIQNRLQSFLDN